MSRPSNMQCFVVSLHRSGTKSLSALIEELGLATIHWPARHNGESLQDKIAGRETDLPFIADVLAPKLANYHAASDVPIPTLYPVLYDRYPDAKFILLRRNPDDWARSVRKSIGDRPFRPFERVQYWRYLADRPPHIDQVEDSALTSMYERHTADVVDYFASRNPNRLGVFELTDPDCGQQVAGFLGFSRRVSLPRVPERRRNRSEKVRFEVAKASRKVRSIFMAQ